MGHRNADRFHSSIRHSHGTTLARLGKRSSIFTLIVERVYAAQHLLTDPDAQVENTFTHRLMRPFAVTIILVFYDEGERSLSGLS